MKLLITATLIVVLLVSQLLGTGCATATRGTARTVTLQSNVPGSVGQINGGAPQVLPFAFPLNTREDAGKEITLKVWTPDGRVVDGTIAWKNKKWIIIGQSAGILLIGALSAAALVTDLVTKAHNYPGASSVMVEFDQGPPPATYAPASYYRPQTPPPPQRYQYQEQPLALPRYP